MTYFQAKPVSHGTPPIEVGSSATIEVMTISTRATMHIHLYFEPSVQLPVTKLSPAFQR